MKRKDALTDLVEHAQDTKPAEAQASASGDRQVVNGEGELITLGLKKGQKVRVVIKGKSLELPLTELEKKVKLAVEKEFKGFAEKVVQKVMAKLDEKGLFPRGK